VSQPAGGHISAAVAALDFSVGFGFKTVATPTAITKTKTINPATAPSHLLALLPDFGYVGIKEGSTVDGGMESGFGPEELRLPSITGGGGGGGGEFSALSVGGKVLFMVVWSSAGNAVLAASATT